MRESFPRAALLLQAAAEREVRIMVDGPEFEDLAELLLRLGEAPDAEVGDPERLANRRFVGLPAFCLLERDRSLGVHACRHLLASLLEEVVGLAHESCCPRTVLTFKERVHGGIPISPMSKDTGSCVGRGRQDE